MSRSSIGQATRLTSRWRWTGRWRCRYFYICTAQWWAQIFEYTNKMALEYYSYSYSCHFPSTNIFGYSFVDFWTSKYIWIFVRKFSKIRFYLNIFSEPYFNIQLSILNEKSKSRYNLCIKNFQCKILFRGNISECF